MTAHLQHVIDYFDETDGDYSRLWGADRHLGLHCGYFDAKARRHDAAVVHMNEVLADQAGVGHESRVLDAGCGIGGSAIWLAERRGANVVGVNVNEKQVARA